MKGCFMFPMGGGGGGGGVVFDMGGGSFLCGERRPMGASVLVGGVS